MQMVPTTYVSLFCIFAGCHCEAIGITRSSVADGVPVSPEKITKGAITELADNFSSLPMLLNVMCSAISTEEWKQKVDATLLAYRRLKKKREKREEFLQQMVLVPIEQSKPVLVVSDTSNSRNLLKELNQNQRVVKKLNIENESIVSKCNELDIKNQQYITMYKEKCNQLDIANQEIKSLKSKLNVEHVKIKKAQEYYEHLIVQINQAQSELATVKKMLYTKISNVLKSICQKRKRWLL